jgi:ribosome-binding protein aMBF1 (putative translation factor)
MAKKFPELRDKMSPESRARANALAEELRKEYPLNELRRARGLSQEYIAKTLKVSQANVSKIERRADMYIGTLRSHIRAMGGDLEIRARFPDGDVLIEVFSEEREPTS